MNQTVEQLLSHYSVRAFLDKPLSEDQIRLLVESAQAASTSNFVQAYSIIGVSDPKIRKELARISGGMSYVEKTGQLFVFVADLNRNKQIAESKRENPASLETTEKMLVAVIDAALAAQNMAVAAEAMGLGICYIGAIRNDIERVSALLNIPEYAIPLFGLTIGYPEQNSAPKPRMPYQLVYHENEYQTKETALYEAYDTTISDYYTNRTGGVRNETWTDQIAEGMKKPVRMDMKAFIEKQRLGLK
ncbi:oxygen-insensitive NADPH nitroreductase [Listeria kieliensis]|uniref:NADPH-flavin oxidoreductase n=1 Tax=Listeria kieliensis TaxID=1621700 RepID=A0A3D8TW52_9LIST|nr:oxygen-insensitive NADPH nitroreductase [Listeria kieliensis]RDX02214.1 NADPH-flavin oxidoreductase [Listeria kieliensis]